MSTTFVLDGITPNSLQEIGTDLFGNLTIDFVNDMFDEQGTPAFIQSASVYIAESEGSVLFEGQRRSLQDAYAKVIVTFQGIYAPTADFAAELNSVFDSSISKYVEVMQVSFSSDISGIEQLPAMTYQPSSLPSVTPSISPTSQDTIAEISVVAGTAAAAAAASSSAAVSIPFEERL